MKVQMHRQRPERAAYHQPNGSALGAAPWDINSTAATWDMKVRMHQQRPERAAYHQPIGSAVCLETKDSIPRKGQHKIETMSQSLSELYVHIVFHTKYNQDLIKANIENELYAYLGGILKENKCVPIIINGTHLFSFKMPPR